MARRATRAVPRETSYQRRIRLYKERHPGATTQQARGKHAGEHVTRKEREVAKTGLTPSQRVQIRKFARQQGYRSEDDENEIFEAMTAMVRRDGYEAFQEIRALIKAKNREHLHQGKVVTIRGRAMNRADMEALAEKHGIDWKWLYYR
jgi:hypothetical protein